MSGKIFSSAFRIPYLSAGNKYKAGRRVDTVRCGAMVRTTSGGRHGIFETNIGLVRKPL